MFNIAWFSCEYRFNLFSCGYVIGSLDPKAVFLMGDTPYCSDTVGTKWGYTDTTLTKSSVQADFEVKYHQMMANPGYQYMRARSAIYMMADDHEWAGGDWDHTITNANPVSGGLPLNVTNDLAGQNDVNFHFNEGNKAHIAMVAQYASNPANTDSGVGPERPSGCTAFGANPSTINYPARYFRVGYSKSGQVVTSNPHVEFFVPDCISHRSPVADPDNASKTMLGSIQKGWLKARLLASTAKFKVIMSSKGLYSNGFANSDSWAAYQTERDELLTYIDSNNITGVLWATGDRHTAQVAHTEKSLGDQVDALEVRACPVGVDLNPSAGSLTSEVKLLKTGSDDKVFGLIRVYDDRLIVELLHYTTGISFWRGELLPTSNAPLLTAGQIGF